MEKFTIGIDLGGTTVTAGLVNEKLELTRKLTWSTDLPRPAEDLEQHMAKLCRTLAEEAGVDFAQVQFVGIGTPGSVNSATGMVGYNVNFGYYDWNLGKNLSALLGCPVYVENDANAAAYGEYMAGAAKGAKNAVCITLGTGIGSGIILDGKIYAGSNYAGGEMGHMVIVKDGRKCNCGRSGCWERYGSARALTMDAADAMVNHPESKMFEMAGGDPAKMNAKIAFDARDMGDKVAADVIAQWFDYVSCGVVNVINTFQPDIVCIGGGVSGQGEALLAPIRAIVDAEEYNRTGSGRAVLKVAELHNDAGVLGAALLGNQHTV